ncbi:MAG TPA: nucleotidyltransferase family protein [Gaiellaceae bacterium]|nr:nucleotidyltransferase family protein [Gaiellaceae bacterium]
MSNDRLWESVDRLIGTAPDERALTVHRLEPLAARRLRGLGHDVPEAAAESERLGAAFALAAAAHLTRARAAVEGPLLVVKGPELAALYPDPATRVSRDVDLVAPDPEAVQQQLLAVGFAQAGSADYYADAAHLVPLAWPGLPVEVEVHGRPNWPPWLEAPSAEALLEGAVPSATGVDGLLAPAPERHALVLAAHAWTHGPLTRLRDLLDVALMTTEADRAEIERVAAAWGLTKLWRTTDAIAAALFLGGPAPRPLRTWARNLSEARERTVLEQHVGRWVGWHAALPRRQAARATVDELRDDLTPERGETWGSKVRRSGRAVRNAFVPRSRHERGG